MNIDFLNYFDRNMILKNIIFINNFRKIKKYNMF